MKIVCATDFSEAASVAMRAAAALAARMRQPLQLLHVAQLPAPPTAPGPHRVAAQELERRKQLLAHEAQLLRQHGCTVVEEVLEGAADEAIVARATALEAALIVIGPRGERRGSPWSLGSIAMRLIKGSPMPVLVVRDESPLAEWAKGARKLRVLAGLDRSQTSQTALAWLGTLTALGKLELVAGHVYAPAEVRRRFSVEQRLDPALDIAHMEAAVASEMRELLGPVAKLEPRLALIAGWGRVSHHLLDLTQSEHADLLVIGTHRRTGLERLWRGSVSLDLAAHAKCNVLTVPTATVDADRPALAREFRRVLVPCDLSENSGRAVAWACSLLARGGTLQLLHVAVPYVPLAPDFGGYVPLPSPTADELAEQAAQIRTKLHALVPEAAAERSIEAQVEVVSAFDAATAIVQAAERLESDAICLTTHGRSGISRALMGSVAESILRRAHVPVLVITPRR